MTILSIRNFTKHKIDRNYLFYVADKTLKKVNCGKWAEVSLVITGTRRIRELNNKYRKKHRATDVLSFGNVEIKNTSRFVMPPVETKSLGEIFICFQKASDQARNKRHSVKKEISILLIHGILHLLGYDHESDTDALLMQKLEKEILESL